MSAFIRTRKLGNGNRSFQVLYRRGGRTFRVECAGSFRTRKEAQKRLELVAGLLAAALDPVAELARVECPPRPRTFASVAETWLESRVDLSEASRSAYGYHVAYLNQTLGPMRVEQITEQDVSALVNGSELTAKSLVAYVSTLRQILDYADITPNPARSPKVRLPRVARVPIVPPTAEHVETLLGVVGRRWRLPLVTIEQTGVRIEGAVGLTWGDVDERGCRFRVTEKGRKTRWVPVAEWLMRVIADTCPREDRILDRRVFLGLNDSSLRDVMRKACKSAGIPHSHPHDLRHRRISLWHSAGESLAQISAWAGHSRVSFTLDQYVHTMPGDEVPVARLLDLLGRPGDDGVMTGTRERGANAVLKPLRA